MAPSIVFDIIGLVWYAWGTQFYITCIEQLVLNIVIVILTIIEFKTAKIYNYEELNQVEDAYAIPKDQMEAKLRADALKGIVQKLKGGFPGADPDEEKLETQSLPGRVNLNTDGQYDSDDEEERLRRRSFPLSPKAEKDMNNPTNQLFTGDVL